MKSGSTRSKTFCFWVAIFSASALTLPLTAWSVSEGKTSVATGFNYTTGSYGTSSTTNIVSIPVIGKYETESWEFKLMVPYLSMTTVGGVLPGFGNGSFKRNNMNLNITTQSGLGDMVASTTYFLDYGSDTTPGIDLTAKVKLPTADKNKGLGTGEVDYALQIDMYQRKGKLTIFGSLGRKFLGSSVDYVLNDIFYGSIGGGYKLAEKTSASVSLDAAQASSVYGANQLEASFSISHLIDKTKKAQAYVFKGLANGSPDIGYGALLTFMF